MYNRTSFLIYPDLNCPQRLIKTTRVSSFITAVSIMLSFNPAKSTSTWLAVFPRF